MGTSGINIIENMEWGWDMARTEILKFRVESEEKEAFQQAAELAGIPLSTWVRERLRRAARIELADVGKQIPFLKIRTEED